jgi:DNA-binding PadR family transcriptional regulator
MSLSTTEFAVLGLLSGGERSGYDLKKAGEKGIGFLWPASKSQVYTVLPRLVKGRYATARQVRQERLPDKQVYRITKRGEEAFRVWLEEPVDYHSPRSPFLLKIFFGSRMSRAAFVAHIEHKREAASSDLALFREIEREIKDSEWSIFRHAPLRWGLVHEQAWIGWCDEILSEVRG